MGESHSIPPTEPSSSARRRLPLPGIEQLWAIMALTLIGVFTALVPTPPHDFWWHLKAGQIIATEGIPTTNMFAWTLPADQPYTYAAWLAEWLFYMLYRVGGLPAPVLARNLLGLAAFTLVALEAHRRSGSWRLAGLAALLAGTMTLNNLPTRTQNWAWVPFALFALILAAYAAGQARPRVLLALPLLMAFWVNAHGSFALGLAMLALVALGETLRVLVRQPAALSWGRIGWLYAAAAGTLAATLLNPGGASIFGYVRALLSNGSIQSLVSEWQPPTPGGIANTVFFLSILALLAGFALGRRRPSITDVLLACAFVWLAWGSQRNVVWYGMLAMPLLAQSLSAPPRIRPPATTPRQQVPSTLITLALLGLLIAVQPPFKARLGLPAPYTAIFADLPGAPELFSADTPVAAAEYLRTHPINGRLFNEMGYGSYLAWALYPTAQVFIDPRIELYPDALWQDYLAIRDARDYNMLLIDTYNVQRVLIDQPSMPKLAHALATDPRWQREYADARAAIYRRR